MNTPILEVTAAPVEKQARRGGRRGTWLLVLALVVLVLAAVVAGLFLLVSSGTQEARALEPWPSRNARPEDVAMTDLSPLGLEMTKKQDAHEVYPASIFSDGTVVEYSRAGRLAVRVTAMRFASPADAADEFLAMSGWSEGNCGWRTSTNAGSAGVIRCGFSDAHERFLWSGNWILEIMTMEGGEVAAVELADKVRDAVGAHWRGLNAK